MTMITVTVTVTKEQHKFMNDNFLKPSAILRDGIKRIMKKK